MCRYRQCEYGINMKQRFEFTYMRLLALIYNYQHFGVRCVAL